MCIWRMHLRKKAAKFAQQKNFDGFFVSGISSYLAGYDDLKHGHVCLLRSQSADIHLDGA